MMMDKGYVQIYSNEKAFSGALTDNGYITAWGDDDYGGSDAPEGSGYKFIGGFSIPLQSTDGTEK